MFSDIQLQFHGVTVQFISHLNMVANGVHRLLLITITKVFGDGCSQAVVQRMN